MNTFDLEMLVDTVMDATESIIAETENVEDSVNDNDMLEVIQFSDIRDSAEELQTFVVNMSENEFISNTMLEQLDDISITLYQNVKYILEHCENEIFSTTETEIMNSFENMRTFVDAIRYTISTFVSESKI
jgi:hypothetical protein